MTSGHGGGPWGNAHGGKHDPWIHLLLFDFWDRRCLSTFSAQSSPIKAHGFVSPQAGCSFSQHSPVNQSVMTESHQARNSLVEMR
jgi:hypothetical protein